MVVLSESAPGSLAPSEGFCCAAGLEASSFGALRFAEAEPPVGWPFAFCADFCGVVVSERQGAKSVKLG
jgi:hypothetical protein